MDADGGAGLDDSVRADGGVSGAYGLPFFGPWVLDCGRVSPLLGVLCKTKRSTDTDTRGTIDALGL